MKIRIPPSALGALLGVVLMACGGGWGSPERAPGSALEVASGKLSAPQLAELEKVGVGEVWVEAGELTWDGGRPMIEETITFEPPRRLGVTLVVRGSWPATLDPEVGEDLLGALNQLRTAAEAEGLFANGFHLDLVPLGELAGPGAVLKALRKGLEKELLLSVSIPRELLEHSDLRRLVAPVDFLVVMLYGQRPGEVEAPRAWDFQQVEQTAKAVEDLGKPYLAGVSILGSTTLLERDQVLKSTTEVGLGDLVRAPGLAVEHGFTLEGIDRQVYSFRAEQPTRVGSLTVTSGQRVRLVRSSTPHMEELARLFGSRALPHRLGELYVRMPGPTEVTGLAVENLVNALGPAPVMPNPEVILESLPPSRRALRMRITLQNQAPEPTDLGFVDHNFVELVASDAFWDEVDAGDFPRFDLLKKDRSGELRRSLQSPNVLRLYVPLLEGGGRFETGVLELQPTDIDPRILVGANFLVPSGRSASFGPREWRLGQ